MSGKIRAVLVGCGGISRAWLAPAVKMKDLEIVGLADLRRASAEKAAGEFGLGKAQIGSDYRRMLKDVKPDAVFVCTLPESHYEITIEALKHGCHVLGEKPLADTMDRARRMVDAAAKAGKIFSVIQNRRYYSGIRAAQRFLAAGKIGDITTLTSDFYIGAHFGGFRDEMKNVLLLDMAIHTFDTARYLSGADPLSVYCHEWNPAGSWYKHGASAIATFEMTGGRVYSYRGSWCSEGLPTTWAGSWRIVATGGTAVWDGEDKFQAQRVTGRAGFIRKTRDLAISFPLPDPARDGHAGLIRDFLQAIRTGRRPLTDCADNIKSLAMVFGAIESARTRKPVRTE